VLSPADDAVADVSLLIVLEDSAAEADVLLLEDSEDAAAEEVTVALLPSLLAVVVDSLEALGAGLRAFEFAVTVTVTVVVASALLLLFSLLAAAFGVSETV
jgi:hypothetical protein